VRAARVIQLAGPGGVEVTHEAPEPEIRTDMLLIEGHAAGVSFPDLLLSQGLYQIKLDPPFTLGSECAGTVKVTAEGSGFEVGQPVISFTSVGAFADTVSAPVQSTIPLPEGLTMAEGAGLIMNYHTAHFALERRGQLEAGEALLVHGAGGGVGTAATQVAKALGARVLAVASDEAKRKAATDAGADEVIDGSGDWRERVKELTEGRGVDAVFDPVGGDRFDESLKAMAPEGRLIVIGFASGRIPSVSVNRLLFRNTSVVGAAWGHFALERPEYFKQVAADLERMVADGFVKPLLGKRYPLAEVSAALADLETRRALGKIVLDIKEEAA
jgi:NADPH2:quinone reductase